uniref:Uncharacterized protein n=1 Tax=uncultured Armatimonadetes bacterium TaxID=157466 RepID=A0A6J4HLM4_9BACT|nr:hypothetical protein AVDCRST_MAG63-822 [uncultured Armatimonadetes bacterium]
MNLLITKDPDGSRAGAASASLLTAAFRGSAVVVTAALALFIAGRAMAAQTVRTAAGPRVAVFAQPGFPFYGVNPTVAPQQIAADLRAAGVAADLLDADALARPDRFNANRYAAVIFTYGNTYPADAFANLKRFHRAGGSLVTTGIPFTHPTARRTARDWEATPSWGPAVHLAPGEGPRPGANALRLQTQPDNWTGVSSARFAVRPGDAVVVSVALRETGGPPRARRAATAGEQDDNLYIRFFDTTGKYLEQRGVRLTPASPAWRTFAARAAAPAGAAHADLSVQLRRGGHRFLVADFAARVNDRPVSLPNADLSRRGSGFLDLGHDDAPARWGPDGIGIGGFAGPGDPDKPAPARVSPGDPLKLSRLFSGRPVVPQRPAPQWLDRASVPKGVRVIPAVGEPSRPLVALVVHGSGAFKGAVDAWTFRAVEGEQEYFDTRQILARATVAVLARRRLLNRSAETVAFRALDALPRPAAYANLTLPRPARRYTTFQPKMPPPARRLYVADVRRLSPDEKLLLISLQGVVNRKQPRVYLLFDDDDQRWLDEMRRQKETGAPIPVADPWSLVDTFRGELKGAVVCDPKVYVSPCVAVSLAGMDDLLVAKTPQLAARARMPVTVDLRGKFKDNADALRYLRTYVAPRLDPYLTCTLDPAVFHQGALDSVIAARGSVFWITGPQAQHLPGADQLREMEEIKALLARMPLGAVVRGFWWHGDGIGLQESAGVALAGRFGKVTLVSDLITNLSVHSGVRADRLTQKPRAPAPPLDRGKVYVAFTMSDGDNLVTWRSYFRRYFDDPVRGTIPVGWGMSPAILDLAPSWARWYYEQATPNDEFLCDVSGVAYMYPSSWGTALKDRDEAFRWFYGRTREYMARTDMRTIRLMDVQADDIARVGPLLPGVPFLMPDYGHAGPTLYSALTYDLPTGQSVFRAVTSGSGPQNLADQIRTRAGAGRPAFVNAFIWNWGSNLGDLKKTLELLGPDYVAVTPSQLNELYRAARQTPRRR